MNDTGKPPIRIPSLSAIEVTSYDKSTLTHALIRAQVGRYPLYLTIDQLDLRKTQDTLNLLRDIFKELGVHPKIPYPLFIVCPYHLESDDFVIVKSKETIPNYFRLKAKKLKKREAKLLAKVQMLTSRLSNYPLYDYFEQMNHHSQLRRSLRDACVEKSFYASTLKLLAEQIKKR